MSDTWKVACLELPPLTLLPVPIFLGSTGLLANLVQAVPGEKKLRKATMTTLTTIGLISGVVAAASFLAYLAARGYLQIEVFLAVFYVDQGVYTVPQYASYWSHR